MNEQFESSLKARKRSLTRFLAQELMLDFVEGRLDNERKLAVETSIEQSKDLQRELQALNKAEEYLEQLSQLEISDQLTSELANTETGLAKKLSRLSPKNWPEMARWSFEALIISIVVASLVSLLPLKKLSRWLPLPAQEYILAEVDSGHEQDEPNEEEDLETPEPAKATGQELIATQLNKNLDVKPHDSADSKPALNPSPKAVAKPKEATQSAAPVKVAANPPASSAEQDDESEGDVTLQRLSGASTNEDSGSSKVAAASSATSNLDVAKETKRPSLAKGPKGFVYRAFMATPAIDETSNSVREIVEKLGGEKAGQVELGMRKPNGSYFHFSLPESNYEDLLTSLRNLGPVRIYKDPHWREMPEGQIRLILFVEDQAAKK